MKQYAHQIRAEYRWWVYTLIPHAWHQMQSDYYFAMGWSIRLCGMAKQWCAEHKRDLYLALCGFMLAVAVVLGGLLWLVLDVGERRAYHRGMQDQFAMIAPTQCLEWWTGRKTDAEKWFKRQMMKGK